MERAPKTGLECLVPRAPSASTRDELVRGVAAVPVISECDHVYRDDLGGRRQRRRGIGSRSRCEVAGQGGHAKTVRPLPARATATPQALDLLARPSSRCGRVADAVRSAGPRIARAGGVDCTWTDPQPKVPATPGAARSPANGTTDAKLTQPGHSGARLGQSGRQEGPAFRGRVAVRRHQREASFPRFAEAAESLVARQQGIAAKRHLFRSSSSSTRKVPTVRSGILHAVSASRCTGHGPGAQRTLA